MSSEPARPSMQVEALRQALVAPHGPYTALDVVAETGSTNAELAAAARAGAADRTVLVAEHQTAGRGRAGRGWVAPPRSGLALSVLLRPQPVPQQRWGWLPLLAGVALGEVVAELCGVQVAVKWPNDLLLGPQRRKAAGILAEVCGDAVVLGIGLNVTLPAGELPVPQATSLAIEGSGCTDRNALLAELLRRLDLLERHWRDARGDAVASGLRDAYRRCCATLGRQVSVALPAGQQLAGIAVDVDAEGRLVIDAAGGRQALSAGDVTHVRPE
ncbi:MAG: biotin--[acetyl-CoA-carboxylase] ligase [Pseudonocardiaceae bacterium]|nr:biotin--[acetyl-CoA-carboxylase] ligase [Pseudonocardiaceae bacterium]